MSLKTALLIGHIIGVAMGAGGATMSDTLFLTSVRDNYIDASECRLLKVASKIVVLGLVILCFTGGAFFLVGDVPSERFWAKMTVVGIAVMNGYIMHRKLFPVFEKCSQEEIPLLSDTFLAHLRLLVSAGTISALSWYAAIILGTWKSLSLSYIEIMAWYLGILGVFLLGANIAISIFGFGLRSGRLLKHLRDPGDESASVEVEDVFEHTFPARQLAG
ncbi:MAG: hypothetical protein KJ077_33085 [Anaerolineae bacterium]|nr:hypothetical protein [Anaerolineae bacterium]